MSLNITGESITRAAREAAEAEFEEAMSPMGALEGEPNFEPEDDGTTDGRPLFEVVGGGWVEFDLDDPEVQDFDLNSLAGGVKCAVCLRTEREVPGDFVESGEMYFCPECDLTPED